METSRQDAYFAETEGLVGQPVTWEKSKDGVPHELVSQLKSFSKNHFSLLNKLSINNIEIKRGTFIELSQCYLLKVLELLVDQDQEVYAFGESCDADEDEKTGICVGRPWVPIHYVLCRFRPYLARLFNDRQEIFDTDTQERPLIPYHCQVSREDSIPLFF